jgi:hypothetical protein
MRRFFFILGAGAFVGGVVVACGGSVTSVDGNKNTSSLDPTDQNQLCIDTYNYIKSSISPADMAAMACGFAGVSSTSDPTTCQSDYTTCVAQQTAAMGTQMNQPVNCTGFDQTLAQCNTTVATYTKCLAQELDMMKSLEAQFPLCSAAAAQTAELAALNKLSGDCIALMQTCQMAFPGAGSSSSSNSPDGG